MPCVQWTMWHQDPTVLRVVNEMVGLGGDLCVYGGHKPMRDGEPEALSDILVARAKGGVVNQRWKRLSISETLPPLGHLLIWSQANSTMHPCKLLQMHCRVPLQTKVAHSEWAAAMLLAKHPSWLYD